jgi:hypothetical protein
MDHSNQKSQQDSYKYVFCPHGKCRNHNPEMDTVDVKYEPRPFLGIKKTVWTWRCCGHAMQRCEKIETEKCRKCGRVKTSKHSIFNVIVAVCHCCGWHHEFVGQRPFIH